MPERNRTRNSLIASLLLGAIAWVVVRYRDRVRELAGAGGKAFDAVAHAQTQVAPLRKLTDRLPSDDLEELTREELYQRAQKAEIAGRSQMTKAELIAALRSAKH
jgi:hypothetical protein